MTIVDRRIVVVESLCLFNNYKSIGFLICSINRRKFKIQQSLSKIRNKFQNYSPKFSIVDAITDISVVFEFMIYKGF